MPSGTLDGRLVEIRKSGFALFWDIQDAVAAVPGNPRIAGCAIVAASAFWADTGEKVFADWRAVQQWPFEDWSEIMDLINLATEHNAKRKQPNGVATIEGEALPSH